MPILNFGTKIRGDKFTAVMFNAMQDAINWVYDHISALETTVSNLFTDSVTSGGESLTKGYTANRVNAIKSAIDTRIDNIASVISGIADSVASVLSPTQLTGSSAQNKGYTASYIDETFATKDELGGQSIWLTQDAYEALVLNDDIDPDIEYKIYEPDSDMDWIGQTPDVSGGGGSIPAGSSILTVEEALEILNSNS